MTVYHVYEVFYDEPWYPDESSSRIYATLEDAQKYGNELIKQALENGETFSEDSDTEFNDDCYAVFFGDSGEDDHRIYIDEYEVR